MESHDEERAAYKQAQWQRDPEDKLDAQMSQLGVNAAFFFTVPGPKMVWQFGRWDMMSLLMRMAVRVANR